MNVPPNELLRMLAGGVNPAGRTVPVRQPADGAMDFRAMLEKAAGGELNTDLPVRVPRGLAPPLEPTQHARLSNATDRAQQHGIARALIDLGDRSLRVDVQERSVIDAPDAQLRAVGDIDGYVRAHKDADEPPAHEPRGPARVVRNTSLINTLADVPPDVD